MEEILNEMMDKYQDIRRNGKILVDVQIPQVNSRIMNIKAEDGTIWYCRMMNGKVYDLVDMDNLEKLSRRVSVERRINGDEISDILVIGWFN